MNRFLFSSKFVAAAAVATAALSVTTVAEARPDVFVAIGFQGDQAWVQPAHGYVPPQPVYVQPQPVYVQPRPVYVQPAPVYVRPPVFVAPREVFERPRFGRYDPRMEWERERAWRHAEWRRHEWRERHGHRVDDRDGRNRQHDHRN